MNTSRLDRTIILGTRVPVIAFDRCCAGADAAAVALVSAGAGIVVVADRARLYILETACLSDWVANCDLAGIPPQALLHETAILGSLGIPRRPLRLIQRRLQPRSCRNLRNNLPNREKDKKRKCMPGTGSYFPLQALGCNRPEMGSPVTNAHRTRFKPITNDWPNPAGLNPIP